MTASSTSGNHDDVYASLLCGAEARFAALYYPAPNTPTLRSGCPSGGACVVSNAESSCPGASVRHILAVGDFNADGELDYGASDGIYFGDGADDPGFTAGAPPDQHADFPCWGAALASDFNADGIVDLAAAPKDAAGLNVMLGAKQSLLASTTLGTNETIIDAAVGDFDGDGTKDIAIALDASSGEACDDQPPNDIAIYFGKAQGFPEDGQVIGTVANLVQLAGGVLYRDATGVASDGLADLAAITQRDTPGCVLQRGSLFTGSATRSIVTPYNMLVRARGILRPDIDIQAISVVDSAYADVPQLAVVMNDKNGSYIDVLKTGSGDSLIPDGCPNTAVSLEQCPELHKFDFGDKKIVAAAIAPMGDKIAAAGSLEGIPAVQVFIEAGPTLDAPTKLAAFPTPFPVERINLVVGDFDGDGRADLAVLAFARPLPALNASSHMQVFLADQLVEGGAGCTYVDTDANIVGLAPLDIGAGNDLVIATTQSVKRIAGIDASCKPTATFPIPSVGNLPLEGGDIQSIAVGDLNADGVDDIAVAAHDRTLILRQSTTTEYERTKAAVPPPEE